LIYLNFSAESYKFIENISTNLIHRKIKFFKNLLMQSFIVDNSVDFFFDANRFSSDKKTALLNRYLMCRLFERDLHILKKFARRGLVISISSSHTFDAGIVAYVISSAGIRVGVDIETKNRIIPRSLAIYVSSNNDNELVNNSLVYWVLKESLFKSQFNLKSLRDVTLLSMNDYSGIYLFSSSSRVSVATTFYLSDHVVGVALGGTFVKH
jgi:hypothetical protein